MTQTFWYPLTLGDTVLRAGAAVFYQLRWSADILDEMERNLVAKGKIPPDKAARLRATMEKFFPEADGASTISLTAAPRRIGRKSPRRELLADHGTHHRRRDGARH